MITAGEAFTGFFIMLALMLIGLPVAGALFAVAVLGAFLYLGMPTLTMFGNQMWSILDDFVLTSIPMFILLGEILVRSRRQVEDFLLAEIDPAHPPSTAWGLSKSAWSWREFHTELEAAARASA